MFIRTLKAEEMELIRMVECFIKEAGSKQGAGDPSRTFERVRLALEVAHKIPHPVNPLVLVVTALFQDLGDRLAGPTSIAGFMAAALVESFLKVTAVSDVDRLQIARAVAKTSANEVVPLDSVEQMILSDSGRLNRLGMVGVVDWLDRHRSRHHDDLEAFLAECQRDFDALYFEESREIGEPLLEQSRILVDNLGKALAIRPGGIDEIDFPLPK